MNKKVYILIILMLLCSIALFGCAAGSSGPASSVGASSAASPAAASGQKTFTLDELAKYDGKNGNPAYVAVNGVVYDVTNVPQWKNGAHNGHQAGADMTSALKSAPHGDRVLKSLPVVGKLSN